VTVCVCVCVCVCCLYSFGAVCDIQPGDIFHGLDQLDKVHQLLASASRESDVDDPYQVNHAGSKGNANGKRETENCNEVNHTYSETGRRGDTATRHV
jgi:hypothetical protein